MAERNSYNPERLKIGLYNVYTMDGPEGQDSGVGETLRYQARYLRQNGHIVHLIAPKHPKVEISDDGVIHFGVAKAHRTNNTVTFTDRKPMDPRKIVSMHKYLQLDIADYNEAEISLSMMEDLALSRSLNIATFHSYNEPQFNWRYYLISRAKFLLAKKLAGKILVSEAQLPYANYYFGEDFTIINNGVDLERFKPGDPKVEKFADDKVNILFVGRLEQRKGLKHLLYAYKRAKQVSPNCRLIIVGNGDLREELDKIVKKESIDDVHFEGRVSKKDLPSYYRTADVFCSPAPEGESFGIVHLEAMASGVPTIAGDNPGYRSVVNGEEGIVVDPTNTELFASHIARLVASPIERQERGQAGLLKAQGYAWPLKVKDRQDFYVEKLKERSKKKSQSL